MLESDKCHPYGALTNESEIFQRIIVDYIIYLPNLEFVSFLNLS